MVHAHSGGGCAGVAHLPTVFSRMLKERQGQLGISADGHVHTGSALGEINRSRTRDPRPGVGASPMGFTCHTAPPLPEMHDRGCSRRHGSGP
eukprot:2911355-Pyramimonas_sp.AAC.1